MNYIFYQTKTNFSNTGDALINQSLINVLRNYGKLYANCSPDIPEQFLEQLGIAKSEQLRTRNEFIFAVYIVRTAFRNLFSSNKIFLFSGLGHTYGGSLKKIIRNIIAGVLFPFYRLLNVHIVRIGISIGPISKGLAMTEFIRGLFISKYYVRDTMSLKLCHNIGIGKAELCPDMSWLYRIGTLRNLNTNSIWVIVNLRNSTLDEFVYDDYIKMLVEKCKVILHTINAAISNLSVLVTYQVTCDKEFSFRLYKELQNDFTVSFVEKQMEENTFLLNIGAAQRLMQALGAYGFLSLKKGKKEYSQYFYPALMSLSECAHSAGLRCIANTADACIEILSRGESRQI